MNSLSCKAHELGYCFFIDYKFQMIQKLVQNCYKVSPRRYLLKRWCYILFHIHQAFYGVITLTQSQIQSFTVKFILVIRRNKIEKTLYHHLLQMLSEQAIKTLQIKGSFPKQLQDISFAENSSLWYKQQHHHGFNSEKNAKRYQYVKIGKTFGWQTVRYISIAQDHLFYYNENRNTDYIGYCSLENVYIQWFELKNGRYMLLISNGKENSLFYFLTPQFWHQQKQKLVKHAIQLDFEDKYQVFEELGSGSFSKVFRVRNKRNGRIFAAKVIFKLDKHGISTKKLIVQEKKLLNLMEESDSTSKFIQFFQMEGQYIFILEYLPGKDLMTVLKQNTQMDLSEKKNLLINLLHLVKECHQRSIIHRDIKPQNVIVDEYLRPKLIDFGLSTIMKENNENSTFKRCGTMGYMAPQVINCEVFKKEYTSKCDIFSLGIIAHLILLGNNPLKGKSYEKTRTLNQQCSIQFNKQQLAELYGDSCPIFLQRMLAVDSKIRYSAEEALNSQFLRESSDKQQSISTIDEKKRNSEVN